MAKISQQVKDKIIADFETMKSFEESTRDVYLMISSEPSLEDQNIKDVFGEIADDEQRHAEIVQKIINIVSVSL
jgi:rubrerythrin